jgi:mono/diheme cytochrome c family protein
MKLSRKTKIVMAAATVVILGGVSATWFIVGRGFSARDEPTALEAFVARQVRGLALPSDARDAPNPVPESGEVIAEAMAHYADHCALCHANDGSGDTSIGRGLYPKPPDLRLPATQKMTDGELFYIIHNGVRLTGMPAFGTQDSADQDTDSWKLVHFIRHLPNITVEELGSMKEMNPKSRHQLDEEEAIRRFLEGDDSPLVH